MRKGKVERREDRKRQKETERETERDRDKERQRDIERDREKERERECVRGWGIYSIGKIYWQVEWQNNRHCTSSVKVGYTSY